MRASVCDFPQLYCYLHKIRVNLHTGSQWGEFIFEGALLLHICSQTGTPKTFILSWKNVLHKDLLNLHVNIKNYASSERVSSCFTLGRVFRTATMCRNVASFKNSLVNNWWTYGQMNISNCDFFVIVGQYVFFPKDSR